MAKNEQTAEAAAPVTEAAAPATDNRYVKVTVPEGNEAGIEPGEYKRVELIRKLADPENVRFTRGEIAAFLTKWSGQKVAYQIVFQATKGGAGVKAAQKAEAAATAPTEGAQAEGVTA